ncbi:MAG: iron-containing alcohol dehydrogenase, partial [Lentisphaerae bacterium]|nr:iron-containing alcohol dehydrogenase [Lentisphaerota bacterium]
IADYLQLGGKTEDEKVARLVKAIEDLKAKLDIPASIREAGVPEQAFAAALDTLAEDAFDDQCTGANPRYPLIGEIKCLYQNAYRHGSALRLDGPDDQSTPGSRECEELSKPKT